MQLKSIVFGFLMKIVVLGPFNSGKSSLIKKMSRGSSISLDKSGTTVSLDHATVKIYGIMVHLFGTPGLERFEVIRKILSKGADGIIFVVDSINPASFNEARELWKGMREYLPRDIPAIIVANKQDIISDAIPPEDVLSYLKLDKEETDQHIVLGVSATLGTNVDKTLSLIVLSVLSRYFHILKAVRDGGENGVAGIVAQLKNSSPQMEVNQKNLLSLLQWLAWRGLISGKFEIQKFALPTRVREIIEIFEFIKNFKPSYEIGTTFIKI